MDKDNSIEVLNKCLEKLTSMSQEEFDKRDKEINNMSCIKESTCLLKNMRGICGLENCISFEKECKHEFVFDGAFCRLCGKAAWETIKVNKEIKEDHGTKELKKLLKSITEMSIEEYNELYERALKDLKEIKMKELKDFTIEELEKEITRRKKPIIRNLHCSYTSDMEHLMNACKEYIDEVGKRDDFSDHRNEIFEKAMELCYGQDIWQYTNSFYKD